MTFWPKGLRNSDFSFSIEVSPAAITQERAEITFMFPEQACGDATRILSSERMPYVLTPSLMRTTEKGRTMYRLILELEPFFYFAGEAGEMWQAAEKIEHVRQEVEETVAKYAKLNAVFQRLSRKWGDKKLLSSFETTLWEVFTGKPRFMSASTEFHRASFGDVTLTAHVGDSGPYLKGPEGNLKLGVSSIIYLEGGDKKPAGYYVAKYGNDYEADIYLKGIAKEGIADITAEFGVPMDYKLAVQLGIPLEEVKEEYVAFYRSRAFLGLQDWVSRNRSFAKRISRQAPYLPDWYERATGQRPIPDSDEDLDQEGGAIRNRRRSRK